MKQFGHTRSIVGRDYALVSPDAHIRASHPAWDGTKVITLIAPQMGARFAQYLVEMEPGGVGGSPPVGVQRFLYVLEGEVIIGQGEESTDLGAGGYAYLPADLPHTIHARTASRLCLFEKQYEPLTVGPPPVIIGRADDVKGEPYLGDEAARLQVLLPDEAAFDMAVNIFTFDPGAAHPFVEVHVMEHGLLMLQGGGIYRLTDQWYPCQEGDVIWMGPYCAQWFCAVGKEPARYLYYKDVNRDALG